MANRKKEDDEPDIIPKNEYIPDLEEEVKFFCQTTPDLPKNEKKYNRASNPKFSDPVEQEKWEMREIRRCIEGYNGISGKMYFYFQYGSILDPDKGKMAPEYRVCHNEWFKRIEENQKAKGRGIICPKRRRWGASWCEAHDVIHDCTFTPFFHVGLNSKSERDSIQLFKKVKFVYDNLPAFLRVDTSAGKSKMHMDFSSFVRDERGNKIRVGTQSEITCVPPTDSAFEGYMLSKWICDEAGKCFGKGTKVRMADGSIKNIEEIKVGEYVSGYNHQKLKVTSTTKGVSGLYQIDPKKFKPFVCNDKHLLSFKATIDLKINGVKYPAGEIIDLTPEEYIATTKRQKTRLLLFKGPAQYKKRHLEIDPYFLGLWLGDGYSSNQVVCGIDPEIRDWIKSYAEKLNMFFNEKTLPHNVKVWTIKGDEYDKRNYLLDLLKSYNLINNKHVPDDYKYSSIEDRAQLIGGLIDSDGYRKDTVNRWEITQRNKRLSHEILDVLNSMGFYTVMTEKVVNNTIYYRICFNTDNKELIKAIVQRKKPSALKKRRHSDRSSFDIKFIGEGEYYGITLEKSPYFLLEDGTVVHNCPNLPQMWAYTEPCMMSQTRRTGMPMIFGTAGDIGKDGKGLIEMWKNSEVYNLERFFAGGWMGLIVDRYGNDLKEDSIRWIIYQRKRRESLSNKQYIDFKQQYPLTTAEAFAQANSGGVGDIVKINAQMQTNREDPPLKVTGKFEFDTKDPEKVIFKPDPLGKAIIYEQPEFDSKNLYVGGCDPADHDNVLPGASELSLIIRKKRLGTQKAKMVFRYTDRPKKLNEYFTQAVMALIYYGEAKVLIEKNRTRMIIFFEDMGYKFLLMTSPQGINRMISGRANTIGVTMTEGFKEYMEGLGEEDIDENAETIPDNEVLQEFIDYGSVNTDNAIAYMLSLAAEKEDRTKARKKEETKNSGIGFSYKNINGTIVRQYTQKNKQAPPTIPEKFRNMAAGAYIIKK